MLRLIDDFINYDLIDMPETIDSKEVKLKTLKKLPKIIRILVSGACSPLAQPLLFSIAKGYVFGDKIQLIIVLYDCTKHFIRYAKALEAELSMGGFKLLIDVIVSNIPSESFKNIDVAILLETKSPPEEFVPVPEEKINYQQYRHLGCALDHHANKSVKVIFVGGNVNTKALICSLYAPTISTQNFTGLSFHFASRASVQIAELLKVPRYTISGVLVWGIDSVDTSFSTFKSDDTGEVKNVNEKHNIVQYFIKESAKQRWDKFQLCVVQAIKEHIDALINGTEEPFPMIVASEGCYNIDLGLFASMPVTVDENNNIFIKKDFCIHSDVQRNIFFDLDKLKKDREDVLKFVTENNHSKLIRQSFIKHLL